MDKLVVLLLMNNLVSTDKLVVTPSINKLVAAPSEDELFVLKKGLNKILVDCAGSMLCKPLPRFVQLCVKPRLTNRKIRERTKKRIVIG